MDFFTLSIIRLIQTSVVVFPHHHFPRGLYFRKEVLNEWLFLKDNRPKICQPVVINGLMSISGTFPAILTSTGSL